MNDENSVKKEQEGYYKELYKNEQEFSVLTTIEWYGALNVKQVALLIGKSEPTAHRQIQNLVKKGLLIVDTTKTASKRGKFFTISPEIQEISETTKHSLGGWGKEVEEEFTTQLKILDEKGEDALWTEGLRLFAKRLGEGSIAENIRRLHRLHNSVQEAIIHTLGVLETKLKLAIKDNTLEETIEEHKVLSNISQNSFWIKTASVNHLIELNLLEHEFFQKVQVLRDKIEKEIRDDKIPEDSITIQYLYMFTGFLDSKFIEG